MQRDMDLIRQIAFFLETNAGIDSESIAIDGYSADQIGYHCELMHDAGLFKANDTQTLATDYVTFDIHRLTNTGHDFVESARNDTLWQKAKTTISTTVGGVTIDVMVRYLKAQALSALGLSQDD